MTDDDRVFELWREGVWRFFLLCRAERAAELRGDRRAKQWAQGVHSASAEWGRVLACEELLPGLAVLRDVGGDRPAFAGTIRRDACREAERSFVAEAAAGEVEFKFAGDD